MRLLRESFIIHWLHAICLEHSDNDILYLPSWWLVKVSLMPRRKVFY